MATTFESSATSAPITRQRETNAGWQIRVSLEALIYAGLFLLAAVLRLLAIGEAPINDYEAHEALAALRHVNLDVPGSAGVADNPLMAVANQLVFFFFHANNVTARLTTAIVGVLLVLAPLLWRPFIGRSSALAMAALLATSPVAMAASRTMSGVTWTMALVFVGGWLLYRYAETGRKGYAIGTTMTAGAIILLTEPTGLVSFFGLFISLSLALLLYPRLSGRQSPTFATSLQSLLREWPWAEGLLATLLLVLVVGTGFFSTPDTLTSAGATLAEFAERIDEGVPGKPPAYALLVALRYDIGLVVFGVIGLYFALSEGKFVDYFLAGWFVWGLLAVSLYSGATPDAALWISVPAAGLTARLVARMFRSASIGYWVVPNWAIPVHAITTFALVVGIVLNVFLVGITLQREAEPAGFKELKAPYGQPAFEGLDTREARIGTFDENMNSNTFLLRIPLPAASENELDIERIPPPIVLQVWKMDDGINPVVNITSSVGNESIFPTITYPENDDRGIVQRLQFPAFVRDATSGQYPDFMNYNIQVSQAAGEAYAPGQFAVITHPGDIDEKGLIGSFPEGFYLDTPALQTGIKVLEGRTLPSVIVAVITILVIMMLFFIAGSLWGSRAAWRGLGFGVLAYFMVFGIGLGWQASTTFADDPRDLWRVEPTLDRYDNLVNTIEEMSRHATGTDNEIQIVVQGQDDGALAWALRDFPNATFTNIVGVEIIEGQDNPEAIIAPVGERPAMGAGYIGQDFTLSETWDYGSLNWTDFVAWLAIRESRFSPETDDQVMLWIRQDVYGVEEVITE
jgi:hypothetical protein